MCNGYEPSRWGDPLIVQYAWLEKSDPRPDQPAALDKVHVRGRVRLALLMALHQQLGGTCAMAELGPYFFLDVVMRLASNLATLAD